MSRILGFVFCCIIYVKQVCVEPPSLAFILALPAFAAERPRLQHGARSYRSTSHASRALRHKPVSRTNRLTDGHPAVTWRCGGKGKARRKRVYHSVCKILLLKIHFEIIWTKCYSTLPAVCPTYSCSIPQLVHITSQPRGQCQYNVTIPLVFSVRSTRSSR